MPRALFSLKFVIMAHATCRPPSEEGKRYNFAAKSSKTAISAARRFPPQTLLRISRVSTANTPQRGQPKRSFSSGFLCTRARASFYAEILRFGWRQCDSSRWPPPRQKSARKTSLPPSSSRKGAIARNVAPRSTLLNTICVPVHCPAKDATRG